MCPIGIHQVGTKLDKVAAGSRAVSFEQGQAFAEANGAGFCEVSSKTRENVKRPFIDVVDRIVQRPQLIAAATANSRSVDPDSSAFPSNPCSC